VEKKKENVIASIHQGTGSVDTEPPGRNIRAGGSRGKKQIELPSLKHHKGRSNLCLPFGLAKVMWTVSKKSERK